MKKMLAIMLAVIMVLGLAACTPSTAPSGGSPSSGSPSGSGTASGGNELAGEYTIKVWCADNITNLTAKQIEDFNASNEDGIKFKATVEAVGEGDAATQMITDVEAGGDIFCFAQDQFARLIEAGALAKLGTKAAETVKAGNDADAVKAVSLNDDLYAYPITADNGYFMYYDKSVIPEEDIGSLEKILADCEKAGKYFSFELANGWYAPAFFFATGCVSEWFTDEDGKIDSVHDTFKSPEGLIAAKGMKKLVDSDMWLSASAASGFSSGCAVVVSGTWDYNVASQALGDNFGAAELPSFEVDGKTYHLGSFNGFKLMGVKPQKDAKKAAALHKLAQYLSDEKAQLERFDAVGWGPSNLKALANEKVQSAPHIMAVMAQKAYATPQGQIHGSWWDIAKVIATEVKDAKDEAGLQAALDHYYDSISSLFKMSEEDKNAFTVIGAILGSNWDKDFPMTEVEPGVWVSEPMELHAGEEFKVRQGKSWDVSYGQKADGTTVMGGMDNAKCPADDIYTIKMDLNTQTLSFYNQEGILPEAAPAPEGEAPDTWGVVGSFAASGWSEDVKMTEKEAGVWVSDPVEMKADDEYKVRANGAWTKNYGFNEEGVTTADGQTNGKVEADGIYIVTLDLSNAEAPVLSIAEKEPDTWAVIGAICGTAWDTDFPMTEVEPGVWKSASLELHAGEEFKVRANGTWDVNCGLAEKGLASGEAVQSGENLTVPADGTYIVTLDLNAGTLTLAAE